MACPDWEKVCWKGNKRQHKTITKNDVHVTKKKRKLRYRYVYYYNNAKNNIFKERLYANKTIISVSY